MDGAGDPSCGGDAIAAPSVAGWAAAFIEGDWVGEGGGTETREFPG